jgi:hypothetical protein
MPVQKFASNMGIEQSEIEAKHENQGASRPAVLSTSREPAIRERSHNVFAARRLVAG